MASSKERLRWSRQFDAQAARMNRQRDMLARAMALLTEGNAALLEIANGDEQVGADGDAAYEWAKNRARDAIERMAEMSASIAPAVEESDRKFQADMEEATNG